MSARKARTEAAATGTAPVDSEEKDVKIPVEAVDDTEANEAAAAEAAENQVEDSNKEATMTEDEMVEAAIRAGEEAADNDFKLKFEQAQKELTDAVSYTHLDVYKRQAPGGQLSALLGSGLELVVVDQAAGLDDGTLLGRHIGNVELNLLDRAVGAHHVRGDVLQVAIERSTDTRHEDVIAHLKVGLGLHLEGHHAPVHHVGAIALGGVLVDDVGQAANHALTARGLLAGRTVTGLLGIEHGACLLYTSRCV